MFTGQKSQDINDAFCIHNLGQQKKFIATHIMRRDCEKGVVKASKQAKSFTFKFSHTDHCARSSFPTMLGFKENNDSAVRTTFASAEHEPITLVDKRGSSLLSHKIDHKPVIDHIQSFHLISHYR